MLPRTNLHSSTFIRCLADMAIVDTADTGSGFAEKLGQWVHFADAIALSAVHSDTVSSQRQTSPQAQIAGCAAARAECNRIRLLLINSVRKSYSADPGKAYITLPTPQTELPVDLAAAYLPYRRFYEAHQRDMELNIQPLRTRVRQTVATLSPSLKKLADLDAALEKILSDRESKLLSKTPAILRKRFDKLFKEHQLKPGHLHQADNPAVWMQAGGWLTRFCDEMQMLLLAEIELRLQPTIGLIEATEKKQNE